CAPTYGPDHLRCDWRTHRAGAMDGESRNLDWIWARRRRGLGVGIDGGWAVRAMLRDDVMTRARHASPLQKAGVICRIEIISSTNSPTASVPPAIAKSRRKC